MSKLCFLVEPDFFRHHVGVRNLILSLYKLLSRNHTVDFLSVTRSKIERLRPDQSEDGPLQWFHVYPECRESTEKKTIAFSGGPQDVLASYLSSSLPSSDHHTHSYRIDIGDVFPSTEYDICIISNPWLIEFSERLPVKKLFGIVYDLVPNIYTLIHPLKPHDFAFRHKQGFEYFNRYCDGIIAISEATKNAYESIFPLAQGKIHALPPMMPASYFDLNVPQIVKEDSIILAAPFDFRKGLKIIPALLSEFKDNLKSLYIYGTPRCGIMDIIDFFNELNVPCITWIPSASASEVHEMYQKSKILLFPSFEEGLGIPIIEAQLMGTRVIVQNEAPMKDLALAGSYLLTKNMNKDAHVIKTLLTEQFDGEALARYARDVFSVDQVATFLQNLMEAAC